MNNSSILVSGFKILGVTILVLSFLMSTSAGNEILVAGIVYSITIYILASVLQLLVDIRDNTYQTQRLLESTRGTVINEETKESSPSIPKEDLTKRGEKMRNMDLREFSSKSDKVN